MTVDQIRRLQRLLLIARKRGDRVAAIFIQQRLEAVLGA